MVRWTNLANLEKHNIWYFIPIYEAILTNLTKKKRGGGSLMFIRIGRSSPQKLILVLHLNFTQKLANYSPRSCIFLHQILSRLGTAFVLMWQATTAYALKEGGCCCLDHSRNQVVAFSVLSPPSFSLCSLSLPFTLIQLNLGRITPLYS